MTTLVKTTEAARVLGVSPATLYAYVSRGRISRQTAADGRSSLFALDEVEALAKRSRHSLPGPRPTIDVRIASNVTALSEDGVRLRGHDLPALVAAYSFESIAELLWAGGDPQPTRWSPADAADRRAVAGIGGTPPINSIAIAALVLDAQHPGDDAATAARRLLLCCPTVLGSKRSTGSYAHRLLSAWQRTPSPEAVSAVDRALGVLADHELATSTLAVRVAASVRTSPYAAFAAGLTTVAGPLHGAASNVATGFLADCENDGVVATVAAYRSRRQKIPGFGHKIYRGRDPRFDVLLDAVRSVGSVELIDEVLAEVGRALPIHPNVDLALAALLRALDLDSDVPLFAVARIAGWAAHYAEELDAAPVRYRGVIA